MAHLLDGIGEQVAFLFAQVSGSELLTLEVRDSYLCKPDDYDRSGSLHVELTDEAQARVIKMAWDRRAALLEAHSHPDPRWAACFSPTDAAGLSQFVPHVQWRLKGAPYVALVFSPGSFDAVVWPRGGGPAEALKELTDGLHTLTPTHLTLRDPQLCSLLEGHDGG